MSRNLNARASALLVSFALRASLHAQTGGVWQTLAPMPAMRQELATAVLNGKIFVIGGYDVDGNSTATVEIYDPNNDTWASAQPIPVAVNHNSAAVAAGKLYSFGAAVLLAFVFDPVNDSWAPVASMNFEHGGTAALSDETRLSLVYPQSVSAADLTWTVEQSSNLTNWTLASPANATLSDNGVTRLINAQLDKNGQRIFLRLRVSRTK